MMAVQTPDPAIEIFDHVLEDPDGFRAMALERPYTSYTFGAVTFHGIALAPDTVPRLIQSINADLQPTLSFFRRSPKGQREPHYIHSDRAMGDWTALLYLTKDPLEEDGTIFWAHESGERYDAHDTLPAGVTHGLPWPETDHWEPWYRVHAAYNRLLLFNGAYYHSRALPENYGEGEAARLVHVTFGGVLWPSA